MSVVQRQYITEKRRMDQAHAAPESPSSEIDASAGAVSKASLAVRNLENCYGNR